MELLDRLRLDASSNVPYRQQRGRVALTSPRDTCAIDFGASEGIDEGTIFLMDTTRNGGQAWLARTGLGRRAMLQASASLAVAASVGSVSLASAQSNSDAVPMVITDPARVPAAFKESPELASQVAAGKLPAVADRVGKDPLVIQPTRDIGRYGGTWRAGFTGPADNQNIQRLCHDHLLYWDATVTKVIPNVAKAWEISNGGKTITFTLRRGMKWSNGDSFTADDIMFWFEDMYGNDELNPSKAAWMAINGKQGIVEKIDEVTVAFKFESPYYGFVEEVACLGAGGHFTNGSLAMGIYAPSKYLKQFHPKYTSAEEVDKKAKEAKFDNWVLFFKNRNNANLNTELPVVTAWRVTSPINTPVLGLERNPFYFGVDTEGNQLPYIDKIQMTLAENLEVLNLRAIAAEYDFQVRHIDLAKVPVYKENEARGNYTVKFWLWQHGTDAGFFMNQDFDADPELRQWITSKDFRNALSLGMDRDQLNEAFWLGLGDPGSSAPGPASAFYLGPDSRKLNSVLDATKANELLDKLGLTKRDAQGFRQRLDGKGRLQLEVTTVGAAFINYTGIAQMVSEQWARNLGIKANVTEVERSLMTTRLANNELQIRVWSNDGTDNPFTYPFHGLAYASDSAIGPNSGKWWQSGGKIGTKPEGDLMKQLELLNEGKGKPADERVAIGKEILRLMVDNNWVIGTVGISPAVLGVAIIGNNFGNVPDMVTGSTPGQTPGNARPEQFYFKS